MTLSLNVGAKVFAAESRDELDIHQPSTEVVPVIRIFTPDQDPVGIARDMSEHLTGNARRNPHRDA